MSILLLEHSESAGSGRMATVLQEYGHKLEIRRFWRGETLPRRLEGIDGVISMGGAMNVTDVADHPWIPRELDLLRRSHVHGRATIGVCLGCQLLAVALGGAVEPIDAGRREIGWHAVKSTVAGTQDVLHAGLPWRMMQMHWHSQHVTSPPPGASVLASSDRCKVQAFSAGMRTYGFQYHFEVTPAVIEQWSRTNEDERRGEGIDHDQLMKQTEAEYPAYDRLSTRLCRNIAEYLIPAAIDRVR